MACSAAPLVPLDDPDAVVELRRHIQKVQSRRLAREWAVNGVRVNTLTPGFFPAEQNRKLLFKDDGSPSDRTKAIWAHTPMNRFGEARELIGASIFLASQKASSFVTGTDIRVDGGFLSQTI